MAPQSLYSQLWERGGKQTSLEFSLECPQTQWSRHFWWQMVPSKGTFITVWYVCLPSSLAWYVCLLTQRQSVLSSSCDDSKPSTRLQRQRLSALCAVPHALSSAWAAHDASWTSADAKQLGSTILRRYVVLKIVILPQCWWCLWVCNTCLSVTSVPNYWLWVD